MDSLHTASTILALQEAVLAPFALEPIRDKREIRDPDQPPQQACLGCVEEAHTGQRFPVRLVKDVVRFEFGCLATREVGVYKISALRDIGLICELVF